MSPRSSEMIAPSLASTINWGLRVHTEECENRNNFRPEVSQHRSLLQERWCALWVDGGNRTLSRHSPVGDQDSGGSGGDMDKGFWTYKEVESLRSVAYFPEEKEVLCARNSAGSIGKSQCNSFCALQPS